jgi:hypothetical protein
VSGTVTVGGEPVDAGTLHFVPVDPKKSLRGSAKIESGAFSAQTQKPNDGLTPGEYTVFIEPDYASVGGESKNDVKIAIPDKYMTPKFTDLKVSIDGPESDLSVEFK